MSGANDGYAHLAQGVRGGKTVGRDRYLHFDHPNARVVLEQMESEVSFAAEANVLKIVTISSTNVTLSFLFYPDFYDTPFPALAWSQSLASGSRGLVKRIEGRNPAILHRKELLLPDDHPRLSEFAQLTDELIAARLLPAKVFIGRRDHWAKYLYDHGYEIRKGRLMPLVQP